MELGQSAEYRLNVQPLCTACKAFTTAVELTLHQQHVMLTKAELNCSGRGFAGCAQRPLIELVLTITTIAILQVDPVQIGYHRLN